MASFIRSLTFTTLVAATLAASSGKLRADEVSDFYAGRQVTFVVGFSAGNAFDLYGRTVARHMGRHIPGNPTIMVQNMPGAGALTAAQYVYNLAPKDGTTIGVFSRSTPMEPLLGSSPVKFDATKFSWIGSAAKEVSVCVANAASKIESWQDVVDRGMVVAATSLSADTGVFATILKNEFAGKIRIVTGYPGGNEITQAIENKEVDGRCGWSWSGVQSSKPAWVKTGFIKVLLQLSLAPSAELPNVPLVMDLAQTERQRQILRLVFSRQDFAWPFGGPPDIPAPRLKALRDAFLATLSDPAFLAEADRLSLEVSPMTGERLTAVIRELYATPSDVVDTVKAALREK